MHPLLWTALLAGGCYSPDQYAAEVATLECDLYQECALLDAFGGTHDSCLVAVEALELGRVTSDACDYSRSEARRCLSELAEATCDDLSDAALEDESACEVVCSGGT